MKQFIVKYGALIGDIIGGLSVVGIFLLLGILAGLAV